MKTVLHRAGRTFVQTLDDVTCITAGFFIGCALLDFYNSIR